jgi:hypothetical protein
MCIRQYFFHKWDVYAHEHSNQKQLVFLVWCNSYLRNECEKTLFAHERRRSECFICANVPNTSSRIEVCTIFFETNIMSDLLYIYAL